MAGSTTYEIGVRLALFDFATSALKTVTGQIDRAYQSLIGFNAEMQGIKTSLSGIVMLNMGTTWEKSASQAESLVNEFTRFAMTAPTTTKELTSFSQAIASATFGSGGSMKDFITITEQGVIAARMFGVETHLAEVQMQEMLLGNVRKTERFTMLLLSAGKMSLERFRELSALQRVEFVKKVLTSDAFKRVAAEMGQNWAGVTTTLIDNVQLWLGAIGKGLFEEITKEIKKWNQYIEEHRKELAEMGKQWGDSLVSAFKTIRDIVAFVVEHKDALVAVGAAYMVSGVGGGKEGLAASLLGAGAAGRVQSGIARGAAAAGLAEYAGASHLQAAGVGILGAASAIPGPIGWLAGGAAVAADSLLLLAKATDENTERMAKAAEKAGYIEGLGRKIVSGKLGPEETARYLADVINNAKERGYFDPKTGVVGMAEYAATMAEYKQYKGTVQASGRYAFETPSESEGAKIVRAGVISLGDAWRVYTHQLTDADKATQEALGALASLRIAAVPEQLKIQAEGFRKQADAFAFIRRESSPWFQRGKSLFEWMTTGGIIPQAPTVNVNIQHIDVVADDPDRFVFGVVEVARRATITGTSRFTP